MNGIRQAHATSAPSPKVAAMIRKMMLEIRTATGTPIWAKLP